VSCSLSGCASTSPLCCALLQCSLLASKNLPAAIEETGANELPESIREKAETVKSQGGVVSLEGKLYGLPELLQRNKEILEEVYMHACVCGGVVCMYMHCVHCVCVCVRSWSSNNKLRDWCTGL